VLSGPLVLSFSTAAGLGIVQTASGAGMLIGSILLSAWGGPKRRVPGIIGFILLGSCGLLLMGLRPSVVVIAAGFFLLLFSIPLASGPSQALFQSKVAPGVQGRVFAIRMMISRSMMPLAFLLAGPLSDKIFEPLMLSGGRLTQIGLGNLLGAGPGRGTGLIFIIAATILILASLGAFMYKPIRNLEDDLPDAID
jgi:DHA3 family macrolide efflux protein-like MFS transporter